MMIICDSRSLISAWSVESVLVLSIGGAMYVLSAPKQYFLTTCSVHIPERKCWLLFFMGEIKCWSGLASLNTNFGQFFSTHI